MNRAQRDMYAKMAQQLYQTEVMEMPAPALKRWKEVYGQNLPTRTTQDTAPLSLSTMQDAYRALKRQLGEQVYETEDFPMPTNRMVKGMLKFYKDGNVLPDSSKIY